MPRSIEDLSSNLIREVHEMYEPGIAVSVMVPLVNAAVALVTAVERVMLRVKMATELLIH